MHHIFLNFEPGTNECSNSYVPRTFCGTVWIGYVTRTHVKGRQMKKPGAARGIDETSCVPSSPIEKPIQVYLMNGRSTIKTRLKYQKEKGVDFTQILSPLSLCSASTTNESTKSQPQTSLAQNFNQMGQFYVIGDDGFPEGKIRSHPIASWIPLQSVDDDFSLWSQIEVSKKSRWKQFSGQTSCASYDQMLAVRSTSADTGCPYVWWSAAQGHRSQLWEQLQKRQAQRFRRYAQILQVHGGDHCCTEQGLRRRRARTQPSATSGRRTKLQDSVLLVFKAANPVIPVVGSSLRANEIVHVSIRKIRYQTKTNPKYVLEIPRIQPNFPNVEPGTNALSLFHVPRTFCGNQLTTRECLQGYILFRRME